MVDGKRYELDSRIEYDGQRGTLKYVGPVADTKGDWLGIDWDDPERGKHNGTYKGIEYFKARYSTSGSFVRPGKAHFGISCPEAIKMRYGLVNDEFAGVDRDNLQNLQKEINAPFLEVVGFSKVNKKQSKFDQLKMIGLRDERVCSAGQPGELERLCPNLEELDLSKNLVNSWKIIADICIQLRALVRLNVSENNLPTEDDMSMLRDSFSTIKFLNIARLNYNWLDVRRCLAMFPSLEELSLSFNVIDTIEEPLTNDSLTNVSALTLEGNLLSDWSQVLKLGVLPRLAYLNLNSNKIHTIRFPTEYPEEKTNLFPALSQLHICENNITEWRSISELEKLANLYELKFRENPVLKRVNQETARQLIIARISALKVLNGTQISYEERRGAEYDYLKLHLPSWVESENVPDKREDFIREHPRYPALVKKYGICDIPQTRSKVELKSNVITVEFVCPDDPSQPKGIKRKLLKDMEVQKVMGLAQRLFKTGGRIPFLSFLQRDLSNDEIPLDKPLQELSYYSMQDGDRILVRW